MISDSGVAGGTRTEKMLASVARVFSHNEIDGLAVAQGAGSFSQGRIVCAVANALGYAKKIKVAVVTQAEPGDVPQVIERARWGRLARPKYQGSGVGSSPTKRGFTIIELLVVIGIIGVLAMIAVTAVQQARSKGNNGRVAADLDQMRKAMALLEADVGKWPNGCPSERSSNPEVRLDNAQAGLRLVPVAGDQGDGCVWTAGDIAKWKGPYIDRVTDPWGSSYYFDPDYYPRQNCPGFPNNVPAIPVVFSPGPNKAGTGVTGSYDCDDIYARL